MTVQTDDDDQAGPTQATSDLSDDSQTDTRDTVGDTDPGNAGVTENCCLHCDKEPIDIRAGEGTDEAVQSGSERPDERKRALEAVAAAAALMERFQPTSEPVEETYSRGGATPTSEPVEETYSRGEATGGVDPLGATQDDGSEIGTRPPICVSEGTDPEPDPETRDPSYSPALECIRGLASLSQDMKPHERREAMNVIRYLIALEDPKCKPADYESVPFGDDEDARRARPAERVEPRSDETEGRRCSRGGRKHEGRVQDGGRTRADHGEMDSPQRIHPQVRRSAGRRAGQPRSLPDESAGPYCDEAANGERGQGGRARSRRENSDSLFPREGPASRQEGRTAVERETGARPRTGRYATRRPSTHAQSDARARRDELQPEPDLLVPAPLPYRDFRHGPRGRGTHAQRSRRGQRSELLSTSDARMESRDHHGENHHGQRAGSNKTDKGRRNGARGRGNGEGQRRRRYKPKVARARDDRLPPMDPNEWSEEMRADFRQFMRRWMDERDLHQDSGTGLTETEASEDDETVLCVKGPVHNNVHVNGLLQNPATKATTKLRMVIDQGQTTKAGILMSESLVEKLGLPYEILLPGKKLGTAKGGAALEKVGLTKPFNIRIPGVGMTFSSKAVVCKDVADECNLGTAFLQNIHKATGLKPRLEFSKDGTRLVLGGDQVELVRRVAPQKPTTETADADGGSGPEAPDPGGLGLPPGFAERGRPARRQAALESKRRPGSVGARSTGTLPVFLEKDTLVKANSVNFVQVRRIPASALLEPVKTPGLGSARAVPGVYRDQTKVALLNLEGDQVLRAGTQIAEIIPTKHILRGTTEEKAKSVKEPDGRAEELIKELRLDEKDLLNRDPEMKEKVKDLIREFTDVFSSPEVAFGKTDLIEFEIKLKPGSQPFKAKVRPTNPKQRADLKEQLDRWQAEDVVEECESPWASALVPVLKKDGSTRWAVDYRPLNSLTIKDSYPLPSITENLEKLQGSQIFSTLDAAGAYHCVPVAAKTRPLMAFVTPFGVYTWKRMPFGASNSGPVYARFMEMLVSKLRSPWTLCYLDDLMVHTVTTEQHLEELRKVFLMHREAGIRLKAAKTDLFETQAYYLGYKITQKGICMREDYVEKIVEWPTPRTVKELSSFLGVVGYYRSFIPKFAALTHEMNAQKKKKELEWNDDLQAKFEHLKGLFRQQPIRAYPEYDGECFEVWPDFSALAFGGVLQQVQNGQRKFIAASGRKTTAGERNYPPTKGELASIVHILRKHEHLLRYKRFKIFTDHQPLKWLRTMKNPKGIYWRWLNELESYDFEVVHVAGKSTGAADGLSRSSHLPEPTAEEAAEGEEFVFRTSDLEHSKLDRVALKAAQEQDEVLRIVKKWVKGDPPKSKEEIKGLPQDAHVYHQHLAVLDVDEGDLLVMKKSPGFNQEVQRILVPSCAKLRDEIFRFSHMHPSAGHFGAQATSSRAALKFYWPGMATELKQRVKKCDTCLAKIQQVNLKGGQHMPRKHGFPNEVLYIDLVGPLPETPDGMRYILTMQDGFSRYSAACTLPNKEAVTVANALLDAWITKFGCPVRIHSDQGKEFQNSIWTQLCDRLQIQKTTTPTYNPQSNLVERFHRTLNSIMRTHLAREDAGWSRFLSMATFAFNTKVNASTGVTPFEGWMGRAAKLPIDLVVPTPDRQWADVDAYIQETLIRFEEMFRFMRKHTEATFKRNARLYTGTANTFKVDDLVWVFSKRKVPNKPTKITDGWTGPYRIVGKPAEVLLDVSPAEGEGRTVTVHVARTSPVRGEVQGGRQAVPAQEAVEDGDPDELAEDLCLPARWVEPADNLLVPVQTAPEPPLIRDLHVRRTPVQTAHAQEGQAVGAGPSRAQSTDEAPEVHSKKRARADDQPDSGKQGRFQGEKRGPEGSRKAEPPKHRRRQAEKRDHQSSDSESPSSAGRPKPKLGWRDLARESESESGLSDQEMQLPEGHLPEEASLPSSEDEDVKAVAEAVHDLGDYVTIDLLPNVKPPVRATAGSAGWDCSANQACWIGPRQTRKVDIGLKMALPAGMCALLLSRSKLASEGITTEGGLIDSDYRGPISAILHNSTETARRIQKGERICQLLILPTPSVVWQTVTKFDDTERGSGGFGHSGQL